MYGSGASLLTFFSSVARQLPEIVVIVVGLVVVLGRKPNHPKASSLAAAGLALLLVGRILSLAYYAAVPTFASAPRAIGALYSAGGLVFSLVFSGALALLVAAVVADRAPR